MTNKSVMTFISVNKISVCLSGSASYLSSIKYKIYYEFIKSQCLYIVQKKLLTGVNTYN